MVFGQGTIPPLKPLKITCTSTDCGNGLHCFLQTEKMKRENKAGACRACGTRLVDWERLQENDIADVGYTFTALKHELIRHHFWHVEIDDKAVAHARRKGRIGLKEAVFHRIGKSIGPAQPSFDGRQTPREGSGNSIFYGQHATASCCRKCVEEWHGIPMGRELTEQEINYLSQLVMLYLEERLPQLTEEGEHIPPSKRKH